MEIQLQFDLEWCAFGSLVGGGGLTSAAFGATLSSVRVERDLFPVEVLWDSTGGAKGEWSLEH
jgi:hypothetical protein